MLDISVNEELSGCSEDDKSTMRDESPGEERCESEPLLNKQFACLGRIMMSGSGGKKGIGNSRLVPDFDCHADTTDKRPVLISD